MLAIASTTLILLMICTAVTCCYTVGLFQKVDTMKYVLERDMLLKTKCGGHCEVTRILCTAWGGAVAVFAVMIILSIVEMCFVPSRLDRKKRRAIEKAGHISPPHSQSSIIEQMEQHLSQHRLPQVNPTINNITSPLPAAPVLYSTPTPLAAAPVLYPAPTPLSAASVVYPTLTQLASTSVLHPAKPLAAAPIRPTPTRSANAAPITPSNHAGQIRVLALPGSVPPEKIPINKPQKILQKSPVGPGNDLAQDNIAKSTSIVPGEVAQYSQNDDSG